MISAFVDKPLYFLGFELLIPAYVEQLLLSIVLGMIIGTERELRGKNASLRTFSIISVGSCLITLLSVRASGIGGDHDPTRIAAQIVSGIGFIGGGVIFRTIDRVEGVTTGALIWFTAAVGMGCGFNAIDETLWAFILLAITHVMTFFIYRIIFSLKKTGHVPIEVDDS
jgi:putative Mg2+ transporter-C (MgtC) family protein